MTTEQNDLTPSYDDDTGQRLSLMSNDMDIEQQTTPGLDKQANLAFAKSMNSLSATQREELYHEIHGVEEIIPESSQLMSDAMAKLELELEKLEDKPAYDLALTMSREYITSDSFRIMFLRAEKFDPVNAARRLVWFLENKLKIFGKEALARPVVLSDLAKHERVLLQKGFRQVLSYRDRSGRAILCQIQNDETMFNFLPSVSRYLTRLLLFLSWTKRRTRWGP